MKPPNIAARSLCLLALPALLLSAPTPWRAPRALGDALEVGALALHDMAAPQPVEGVVLLRRTQETYAYTVNGTTVQCPSGGSASLTGSKELDVALSCGLLVFSGLFSGLTLGLMSLDMSGLELRIRSGTNDEKRWAERIKPVRSNGNFLLCTLLLGNTLVNALIAILSASITSGIVGALLSTGFIVVFGEIMPQSVCSRYGLMIGAHTVPLVKMFMLLLYPVAKPISVVLNWVLGEELRTIFSKEELQELVKMTVEEETSELNTNDQKILEGTLKFANQKVGDIMTRRFNDQGQSAGIFMVAEDEKLDFEQMLLMYKKGHTRIPVCRGRPENPNAPIVGLMLTKDLIMLDPDDDVPVSALLQFCGRELRVVSDDTTLEDMLTTFLGKQQSVYRERSHLFFVMKADKFDEKEHGVDRKRGVSHGGQPESEAMNLLGYTAADNVGVEIPGYEHLADDAFDNKNLREQDDTPEPKTLENVIGLVTLEDILEEILQAEIVDETDNYENNEGRMIRKNKHDQIREENRETFFREMCMKNLHAKKLGNEEIRAVTSFLYNNVKPFASKKSVISLERLGELVKKSELRTIQPQESTGESLYRRGTVYAQCCLVLSGKLRIRAGEEAFESECGPFTILGCPSLTKAGHEEFVADFTAQVYEKARVLVITRVMYRDLLVGAQLRSPMTRNMKDTHFPESPETPRQRRHSDPSMAPLYLGVGEEGLPSPERASLEGGHRLLPRAQSARQADSHRECADPSQNTIVFDQSSMPVRSSDDQPRSQSLLARRLTEKGTSKLGSKSARRAPRSQRKRQAPSVPRRDDKAAPVVLELPGEEDSTDEEDTGEHERDGGGLQP